MTDGRLNKERLALEKERLYLSFQIVLFLYSEDSFLTHDDNHH